MRLLPSLLAFGLMVHAPAPAHAAGPFLMPGLTEISVEPVDEGPALTPSRVAISYGLYLAGPFRGSARVELRRGNAVVAREARARSIELKDRQTLRLGTGAITDGRFLGAQPDFVIPGALGAYALSVVLSDGTELSHRFQLAPVKTTGGTAPGIPAADYLAQAALRLSPPYFGERCRPQDALWMTIPTDLRQERTRVDFLFYQGRALLGSFFRDVPVGPLRGEHLRLKVPLAIGGWMDNISREQVLSRRGPWEIHVIQDARYLTTCSFSVEGGHFFGEGAGSRALRCAPQRGGMVREAQGLAARAAGHRPGGLRALEVMALHRSAKVRTMRRQLLSVGPEPELSPSEKAPLAREYRRLIEELGRGE